MFFGLGAQVSPPAAVRSWMAAALMHMRKYGEAKKWNDAAEKLVRPVFGENVLRVLEANETPAE